MLTYKTSDPDGQEHPFEIELGDCLEDAVSMFGPETIHLLFTQKAKDSAGRKAKLLLKKHPPEKVRELMRAWRPESNAARKKKADVGRAHEALGRLPQAALKEVLREQARSIHSSEEA